MCWSLIILGLLLLYIFRDQSKDIAPAPRWEEDDPYLMAMIIEEDWDNEDMID